MIFCIDCDNVLCNLQEAVLGVFNAVYDKNYTLETFDKYSVSECMPKEDAINMIAIYNKSGIYDLVKPLQGAQNAIKKLIRAGHEVYIVTDAHPCILEEKSNWIKYTFPEIDDAHIICMKHKWLLKCDVMIEDNLDNLLNGHHYDRIVIDYPWNRTHDEVYSVYRAFNWDDVLNAVNKINKTWRDVAV